LSSVSQEAQVSRLQLSVCLSRNILTGPLLAGQVVPEGIDWTVSALHPSEMFWRQLKYGDFDVSEMSLSSLCIAADHGVTDWAALPARLGHRQIPPDPQLDHLQDTP
jgi:4,5-dihydroxyphthalate decarboxylase